MTKIISLLVFSLFLFGCNDINKKQSDDYQKSTVTNINFSAFNDANYVWEEFIFPTNRTEGVIK